MAAYFLDSSAAAKMYMIERGTAWVTALTEPVRQHEIFIARITAVEIAAAIFHRVRAGSLSSTEAVSAVAALRRDLEGIYGLVELTPAVSDLSLTLAEAHGLRGYDCVQLASALLVHRHRVAAGLDALELVSADGELNEAARAESLVVVDPNRYP